MLAFWATASCVFFSSRRRHTRCSRDWSSDVCSSDLAVGKAADAHLTHGNGGHAAAFDRMKRKVAHAEAHSHAKAQIAAEDIEHRLSALEKEDRIEQALGELKTRRGGEKENRR